MKTLRFEGDSDDTFGEYACIGRDYDNGGSRKPIAFRLKAGGEMLDVVGLYGGFPGAACTWMIGVAKADDGSDDGAPLPQWPMRFVPSHDIPYTHVLEIDVPDDVTMICLNSGQGCEEE